MIADGYTVCDDVEGLGPVVFRPAIQSERVEALRILGGVGPVELRTAHVIRPMIEERVLSRIPESAWSSESVVERLLELTLGFGRSEKELADVENLRQGTRIRCLYPKLEEVSCDECKAWIFGPVSGRFSMRDGKRVPRPEGDVLMCETRDGCPKGTPEKPMTLTEKNSTALAFDYECRKAGSWPDDATVRRNAAVITDVLSEVARER